MKPIQDTELYKTFLQNARPVTNDPMINYRLYETDAVFLKRQYCEGGCNVEVAKEDLAYYAVFDILKKCGITSKDLELLTIAKELAKED